MKRTAGFTIVELLIVIVVIAILAAVTIVAYTGIQQSAKTSVITQSVQDWENAIHRAVVDGFVPTGVQTCLGSPGDFPATATFPAGSCFAYQGAAVLSYEDSAFTGWPTKTSRPKGLLPSTKFTLNNTTYDARGVWIEGVDTTNRTIIMSWMPQNKGKCGSGINAIGDENSTQGALEGAYCAKYIAY